MLVASDQRDLDAIAADLRLRFTGTVLTQALDLRHGGPARSMAFLSWERELGPVDAALFPIGFVAKGDDELATTALIESTVQVNMLAVMELATAAATAMKARGTGSIVGFTSIAAAVPRGRNMVYAAAKAGLETWLAALRHHLSDTQVRVQAYALGYVDTAMTHGLELRFPAVPPGKVARRVVTRLQKDVGLVYFPSYWWLVTRVLRLMPWWIYRRLRF